MALKGKYYIAEIFCSLQGEGVRTGTRNVFVRFAGCNLNCAVTTHGFDCDTDFKARKVYDSVSDLVDDIVECWGPACGAQAVIFTGGEPALQLDDVLVTELKMLGFYLAIETNGTFLIPWNLDWICVSPKQRRIVPRRASEVKFVLGVGQEPDFESLPKADHYIVSPAFDGLELAPGALKWCIEWVHRHPGWRLSVQDHKAWAIR